MTMDRDAARDAMEELRGASKSVTDRTSRIVESAIRKSAEVVRGIATELASRERELSNARAALEDCLRSENADCSASAARVHRAEASVIQARGALASARSTQSDLRTRVSARKREITRLAEKSEIFLLLRLRELRDYVALAGGGEVRSTSATGGGGGTPSPASSGPSPGGFVTAPGLPVGFALVPLALIDQNASTVHGVADFQKGYSPDDLAWAFEAFQHVVLPALAAGKSTDYFRDLDQRGGLQGTRSYSMTHSQFLGAGDAIRLNLQPNGTFTIANGQHRVWVASRYGIAHVPARVP